jgi:hypothetical protein
MAIRPTDSNVTDELRKADRGSGILPLCRQRDDGHDLGLAARGMSTLEHSIKQPYFVVVNG